MFTTRKLINTPSRDRTTVSKGHEFTPIGSKSRTALEPISINSYGQTDRKEEDTYSRPLFRPFDDLDHGHHNHDENIMDSSFDQTTDNFNQSFNVFSKPQRDINIDHVKSKNNNLIEENKLINNGVTSIKEQELRSRELERENYNLKIKLATLQRFFEQSPKEQQELLSENISLKRQLMESLEQINDLKKSQVSNLDYDNSSSHTREYELKIQELHSKYQEIIEDKNQALIQSEHRIDSLEDQLNELNRSHSKPEDYRLANQELNKIINDLKDEIQDLNAQINDVNKSNQKLRLSNNALQTENSEIENSRLANQELNKMVNDLKDEIEELNTQINDLNKSNQKLKLSNNALQTENSEIENSRLATQGLNKMVNDLKDEIDDLNSQINDLNKSNQKLRLSNNALQTENSEIENHKRQLQENIESLKHDLAKSNYDLDIIENKHIADKDTIDEDKHRLNELQKEVKYWKEKYEAIRSNFGIREHEIEDLKFQIKEYQQKVSLSRDTSKEYHFNLEKLSSESKTLNRRIEYLEDILKQKDQEEARLRDQLSSLLKDKENNNSSKFYEQEIKSLRANEDKLNERIRRLMSDLDTLKEQTYSSNNEKMNKLQDQIFEQKSRISYYEKEYENLEKEYKNNQSLSERKLNESKRKIENLENEIQILESKLASKSNNSAILELESMSRKKLEEDIVHLEETNKKLNEEIDEINFNLRELQDKLDNERRKARNESYFNSDYESLQRRYKELQDTLKENEIMYIKKIQEISNNIGTNNTGMNNINNNHYEIEYHKVLLENNQLQNRLKELEITKMTDDSHKNMLIQKLEKRIYEITNNVNDYDDEKTDLIRQKSEKDSKLRKLELELENITKDHQSDISYYKERISILEKKLKENINKGNESIQLLLEMQLEDIKKSKNELSKKLNESISSNERLKDDIKSLRDENKSYSELVTKYEKQEKVLKLDTNKLEIRNKSLIADERRLNSYIEKLVEKIKQLKNKEYSDDKADLNSQLSKLSLNSKHKQETRLLANELKYYKAKLYDINMKANDLQVMYSLITGSIKNSNDLIKTDIMRLKELGLYNDRVFSSENSNLRRKYGKKLSFKILAKFVLASVRMKNRYEKSTSRKLTLLELKNSIESDKIELIS